MRECPVCKIALEEVPLRGERVDICGTCRGIFLDRGELENILEMARIFEEIRLSEEDIPTVPQAEVDREVICPADGTPMEPKDMGGVIVDRCGTCEGVWLDGDELAALKLAESNIRENLGLYTRLGK